MYLTPHDTRMSSATSKKPARPLRRTRFAATKRSAARNVPDLMAELREAEIRQRIKRARREAGLSQSTMAELLGVIQRTVQNYENDHVPWGRLGDIADITGTSLRWLLHGDGSISDASLEDRLNDVQDQLEALPIQVAARVLEELQRLDEEPPPREATQEGPPQ